MMNYEEIRKEYTLHHTACHAGYQCRKEGFENIEPYEGKFGKGYKVHKPRYDSTQYHYVEYWVK
jgi:hypothetical protein